MILERGVYRTSLKQGKKRSRNLEYIIMGITALAGIFLLYINYKIYLVSREIYKLSKDLLDVNIKLYEVSKQLLHYTKELENKI